MFSLQDKATLCFAEREANFFSEFTAAGRRKELIVDPAFSSPLNDFHESYLNSHFDPFTVTQKNWIPTYVSVRNFVLSHLSRNWFFNGRNSEIKFYLLAMSLKK